MSRFAEDLLFILFVLIIAAILGFSLAWFLRQRRIRELEGEVARLQSAKQKSASSTTSTPVAAEPVSTFDAVAAKGIMGKRIKEDDLTLVEGIGPKISGLLKNDGCATWRQLAERTPSAIKAVLDKAGKDYQIHDPATWPQQARLAADGDWEALKVLQDGMKGGRT